MSRIFRTVLAILVLASSAFAQWNEQLLYSFQGGTDGEQPVGSIVFDSAGNLYGATQEGGSDECTSYSFCGIVYQLAPPEQPGGSWTETILHVFQGHTTGDASEPLGGLVIDANGNLYGATGGGGTGGCEILGTFPGCGAVYEVSPPAEKGGAWTETVLYSFQGGTDGAFPSGDLVRDSQGNLYGATVYGGGYGINCGVTFYQYCGTLFELSPPKVPGGSWAEQVLYRFKGIGDQVGLGDGASPNGGLLIDSAGAIYGTTQIGGTECPHSSNEGCGTVYRLDPPANGATEWTETILHRFVENIDGGDPTGGLIFDAKGNLYGVMPTAPYSYGSIFHLVAEPNGAWADMLVQVFNDGYSGGLPEAGLSVGPGENFYGTASSGGGTGAGTLFRLAAEVPGLEVMHEFQGPPGDGYYPDAKVIFNAAGDLFGTTREGGTGTGCAYPFGCGTVYKVWP